MFPFSVFQITTDPLASQEETSSVSLIRIAPMMCGEKWKQQQLCILSHNWKLPLYSSNKSLLVRHFLWSFMATCLCWGAAWEAVVCEVWMEQSERYMWGKKGGNILFNCTQLEMYRKLMGWRSRWSCLGKSGWVEFLLPEFWSPPRRPYFSPPTKWMLK